MSSMNAQLAIPEGWDAGNIPDQSGKKILITGGTSGLGLAAAQALTRKGAEVTITARNLEKARHSLKLIGQGSSVIEMDLMKLSSVRSAAQEVLDRGNDFNVVILNAGIMAVPLAMTQEGFESQMGTNHLGHYAFAGLIKEVISERIVSVSSQAHRMGAFGNGSIEDIRDRCCGVGKYSPWAAYGASKLSNLLFIAQIERLRLQKHWRFIPVVAHPGWSATHLFGSQNKVTSAITSLIAQPASRGALPILCAATFPGLIGNSYIGPSGAGEMRGTPKLTRARALAYDQTLAANLWAVSEELTGIKWETSPHA